MMNFRTAIKIRLAELDATQQGLFRGTDIYPEYLASFITLKDQSKRVDMRLGTLCKIAEVLELKPSELLARAEQCK
jgi:DNA-binding Xre family transcriptional regulator